MNGTDAYLKKKVFSYDNIDGKDNGRERQK